MRAGCARAATARTQAQHTRACREKGAQLGAPLRIGEACSFHTFRTNNYKLHFHESLSGIKARAGQLAAQRAAHAAVSADRLAHMQIVLTTPPEVGDLREALAYVHGHIYVEFIAKNPLHTPGQPFRRGEGCTAAQGMHACRC